MSIRVSCDCGFSRSYRTQAQADYHSGRHSCAKWEAKAQSTARRLARSAAIDRTPKDCHHKRTTHVHGTYAAYTLDRCRCGPCCAATTEYERQRVRRNAYGRSDLIDAQPIRDHITALRESGISLRQITKHSGVHGGALTKLYYRHSGKPPAARIRKSTAARILALTPGDASLVADGRKIPGHGAQRRLQALATLGWSVDRLGRHSGLDRQRLDRAARGGDVVAGTHRAVVALYDELWSTPPTAADRFDAAGIARTRKRAARLGWAPPLAWDDESIDDPDATPATATRPAAHIPGHGAVNVDSLTDCASWGMTIPEAAHRLGVGRDAIERGITRHAPELRARFARNAVAQGLDRPSREGLGLRRRAA